MKSVTSATVATYEVKRSKFIAHLVPIDEFDGLQERLKSENPKSNHTVYALRYINEYEQTVENSSDDGEPKGAAGVPALNVLRGEELVNVAVLIVRYFGGIKLGVGGMARAYASAVKEVVALSDMVKYEKKYSHAFESSYSEIQKIEYLFKKLAIEEVEREFLGEKVAWKITTSEEKLNNFKEERCTR
jgi:uncharacterized YigZ family protein